MSVVDFSAHSAAMAARAIAPLLHGELDGLLEPLSQAERRDVRDMLDAVARQLALRSDTGHGMRQRLDAMIAALIGVADAIDGDCDLEPYLAGCQCPGTADEAEPDGDDEHNTAPERQGKGFVLPAMFSQDGDEPGDSGIADRDGWLEQRGGLVPTPPSTKSDPSTAFASSSGRHAPHLNSLFTGSCQRVCRSLVRPKRPHFKDERNDSVKRNHLETSVR